jgi:hypothetical protein
VPWKNTSSLKKMIMNQRMECNGEFPHRRYINGKGGANDATRHSIMKNIYKVLVLHILRVFNALTSHPSLSFFTRLHQIEGRRSFLVCGCCDKTNILRQTEKDLLYCSSSETAVKQFRLKAGGTNTIL